MSHRTITPRELYAELQAGQDIELIDVRTPAEYRAVHVSCARNVPLESFDPERLRTARNGSAHPLYVICRSGNRSRQACDKLLAAGVDNLVNVEGGTQAWEQAGLPVTRGQQAMSLERQVRIAAGSLVLVGAALGALVSPYWIGLAAFVGAGLVFAGITDTCGMAMLLARMPWNQVATPGGSSTGPTPAKPSCCG